VASIPLQSEPARAQRRWPWAILAGGLVLVLAAGALLLWSDRLPLEIFRDRAALQAFLDRHGARAPLALMALQAAQVIVAPIPGHFLAVAAGMLFGPWLGTLYTVIGVGAGSALALVLARLAGRPLVSRLVPAAQLAQVDRWAAGRAPVFFFLFFLVPFLPDDLACFAAALSPLPLRLLLGIIVVARLPGHFASAWIGATATRIPLAGWVAIAALALALTAIYWRRRRALERWLLERIERRAARRGDGDLGKQAFEGRRGPGPRGRESSE